MSKKINDKSKVQRAFQAHLITLGDGQVGKTSLILRFIDNVFSGNYLSTIGIDVKIKKVTLENGKDIIVKISDTAGQERFKAIASNYTKKANGIILVYDITNPESFMEVEKWLSQIKAEENTKPAILIGNKSDLEEGRQISTQEGKDLAKKYGEEINFYETSCKTGNNVEIAVMDLVYQIYSKSSVNDNIKENIIKIDKKKVKKNKKKKCLLNGFNCK